MAKFYTEASRRASEKYNKANTRQVKFALSLKYDADILARLDSIPNKQGYFKRLVREDIRRENPEAAIKAFVSGVFLSATDGRDPMTTEDAAATIEGWSHDGVEYPDGLTAESLREIWNNLINDIDMKKEEETMKKYQINLTDANGATSAIDTVTAPAGYTAEDYIRGCRENADPDWCEMLDAGTVTVEEIDD